MASGIIVTVDEERQRLNISLPLIRTLSKSRKSILRATTNGNMATDIKMEGETLVVGVNAYTPIDGRRFSGTP